MKRKTRSRNKTYCIRFTRKGGSFEKIAQSSNGKKVVPIAFGQSVDPPAPKPYAELYTGSMLGRTGFVHSSSRPERRWNDPPRRVPNRGAENRGRGAAENTARVFNRESIAVSGPQGVSLVCYERQEVKIRMTHYDKDGKKILYMIEHIISGDLKDTMDSFVLEFDKLRRKVGFPRDYASMDLLDRKRFRMFAMIPKIIADTSAAWHIGEFIRRNDCVLRRDPSTGDTEHLASMVVNFDTDTETFWFPDGMVFQGIPGTPYYSGNVFSFIKAEILDMMHSLAVFKMLKPEHEYLGSELMRLTRLYDQGVQDKVQVLRCRRNIQEEFEKIGTFGFLYREKGKANMEFTNKEDRKFSIQLDDLSDKDSAVDHGARQRTYLEIVRIMVDSRHLVEATKQVNIRFNSFTASTTMEFKFLPIACLFREMFGMDELFFENMRFAVLESVSKKNHDQERDPRVNQLCPAEDTPIRNVAFFKVVAGNTGTRVVWIHSKNARSVTYPGVVWKEGRPCTAIANGLFPTELQDIRLGPDTPIQVGNWVYTSYPSVKAGTAKRVIASCFDSQRPIERVTTGQSFFHTPPIPDLMFSGTKLLGKTEKDESKVVYEVTYHGHPRLVIELDNEPLKTCGLVYIARDGEVMKVEGTVSSTREMPSYFENLFDLIEMEKNKQVYIPALVTECLDAVFKDRSKKKYTKMKVEDDVREYIRTKSGHDGSLTSFLKALDTQFGEQYSSGAFQRQIDDLKRLHPQECQMGARMGSLPQSKSASAPKAPKSPKAAELQNVSVDDPPSSQGNLDPFSYDFFSQGEELSQRAENALRGRPSRRS